MRDPPKPDYGAKALADTLTLNGYRWFLLLPPERAYAADRSAFAGGPLATAPMEGAEFHGAYDVYSVNQMDSGAPLSKWRKIGFFQTEQECEDGKTKQLQKVSDPAWLTAQANKSRTHIVDPSRMHDMVEAERCVGITELNGS